MNQLKLKDCINKIVNNTIIHDIHTHLFPPSFEDLFLCGIDEILTYHYLIAEVLRVSNVKPKEFWKLEKHKQADHVWQELFIKRSPLSEASTGVLIILNKLNIPLYKDLNKIREKFSLITGNKEEYVKRILDIANIQNIVMTNDPFNDAENKYWNNLFFDKNSYFQTSLRLDGLFNHKNTAIKLNNKLFSLDNSEKITDFLLDCIELINPLYLAVSFSNEFKYPADDKINQILTETILPLAKEKNLPLSIMLGAKRSINSELRLAGDGVCTFGINNLEKLCSDYKDNKFLITMLSRENQYELTVLARKFSNIMPFGVWWFLNNPLFISEITRMRTSLLGFSYIPQHSDSRVLEHLIYKWGNFKIILNSILLEHYTKLLELGWDLTESDIKRDVVNLYSANFLEFLDRK
ncbi:MAG: hypothetical protein PHC34_07585 [Candidatus Gastranaerophilales bacterium]|nr:hypothetical protein [Candidatus Gastranaerophilales bacterium]